MIGSGLLGPGTLLLNSRTVYNEHGISKAANSTIPNPFSKFVSLGDLGVVDGAGEFQRLFSVSDDFGPNQEQLFEATMYHATNYIPPLMTYQSERFAARPTAHMRLVVIKHLYILPLFIALFSSQRSYTWTASKAKQGTILALPNGGEVFRIKIDSAIKDSANLQLLDRLSLLWYQKAVRKMGSSAYNGALLLVSAVHVAPVFYLTSFFSETRVAKVEVSLKPYEGIDGLYLWTPESGNADLWHSNQEPSCKELEMMTREKAVLPVEQVCALTLTVVGLGQAVWDRQFSKQFPRSQSLYELANAPEPSIKSESSSIARAAKKVGSFFKPS